MKKIYLLLVALVTAIVANATASQLFMLDNFNGGAWNNKSLRTMTEKEAGVFEISGITVPSGGGMFKFSKVNDDWGVIETGDNAYVPSSQNTQAQIGGTQNSMTHGNTNSWVIEAGTYKFTVDTNNNYFTVVEDTTPPQPQTPTYKYAIHTSLLKSSWESYPMTWDADNEVWTLSLLVKDAITGAKMGIKYFDNVSADISGEGTKWLAAPSSADKNITLGTSVNYSSNNSGGDFVFGSIAANTTLIFTLKETSQGATGTLTVASEGYEAPEEGYVLRTDIFGGTMQDIPLSLISEEDGRYQYTGEVTANGSVCVVYHDGNGGQTLFGSAVDVHMNTPIDLTKGSSSAINFNRFISDESHELYGYKEFRLIFDPEYSVDASNLTPTLMFLRVGAPIYLLGSVDKDWWRTWNRRYPLHNLPGTNIYCSDFVEFKGNPDGKDKSFFLFTSTPSAAPENEPTSKEEAEKLADWTTADIGRYSPGVNDIDLSEHNYKYQIIKNTNNKAFSVPTGTVMRAVINLDTRYNEFYRQEDLFDNTNVKPLYLHGDLWKHRFDWGNSHKAEPVEDNYGNFTYTFEEMLIEDHGDGNGYYTISNWFREGDAQAAPARVAARAAGTSPDEEFVSELAANGHVYKAEGSVLLKNSYSSPEEALVTVPANTYHTITVTLQGKNERDENNNITKFAGDIVGFTDEDVTSYITTGVEGVDVEEAGAPVEYYNMQGVRVANPENGVYIRRQGNRVTKVVL